MTFPRFFHSLRFKITLAVTLTLVVILGASLVWRYDSHRQLDMEEARTGATASSALIAASMQHAFATNDAEDLKSIVDNVSRQPAVRGIYLYDANGKLALARTATAGTAPTRSELDTWLAPNGEAGIAPAVYAAPTGEQILRRASLVLNQPACYRCHDQAAPVLGVLVSDFALTETNYQLTSDLQTSLVTGIITILVVVIAINLLLSRFVISKLETFSAVLQHFGQGDLSPRVTLHSDDEIGELALGLNRMADRLQARDRENARLYSELEAKEAARAYLLDQVIAAQEDEHKRLARELHDDLAQSLTALSITVQSAIETIPAGMENIRARLTNVQRLAQSALVETGRWIQDLRPRVLDDLGLVPAIRSFAARRFEGTSTRVDIQVLHLPERLPPEIEITLYRVLQEALANVARHAHAQNVVVRLDRYPDGTVVAHVNDDGVGFLPSKYLNAPEGLRGIGLLGMRERVTMLGGTLTIDSTPGRGTRLRVEVPCPDPKQ